MPEQKKEEVKETNKLPDDTGKELEQAKETISERKAALEAKNAAKLAKLEAEKKKEEVKEKAAPKKAVLKGFVKHNGGRYEKGSECPKELLAEFKTKGFIEYV